MCHYEKRSDEAIAPAHDDGGGSAVHAHAWIARAAEPAC